MEITALIYAPGRATAKFCIGFALACVVVVAGCSAPTAVPVREQSGKSQKEPIRVVRHGETLYSIAWETGKDPAKLAQWNKIKDIDRIRAGQQLRLSPPSSQPPVRPGVKNSDDKNPGKNPGKKLGEKPGKRLGKRLEWVWPTQPEHVTAYNPDSGISGLQISGESGQRINSAASGQVVYAGEGLRGYGRLLIVKHNDEFLSAYAHNRRLLVKEGQWVNSGQVVAEMGSSGTDSVKLHFEIRKNGEPVDPGKFLPSN